MMPLRLYDLAGADPTRRFSPYCWRIRMALAHKELSVETIPWRFTEKDAIADSGQSRVPVLIDGEKWLADSWPIANYLEDNYPDRPSLFGGEAGRSLSFFYSNVADALVGSILPLILLDIYQHIDEKDRTYFRASREERVGTTLEKAGADRDTRVATVRQSLAALRMTLKAQPFFGGERPLYADYAIFGPFQWARCISPFALLAADDPILSWRDRMLDLFGGLARSSPAYDA
jgi:glutathione S-transferase